MRDTLNSLKTLARYDEKFEVKCFRETPNFKILLFDDDMFISSYNGPRNDSNAKMIHIRRDENPIFTGMERYFDALWKSSDPI